MPEVSKLDAAESLGCIEIANYATSKLQASQLAWRAFVSWNSKKKKEIRFQKRSVGVLVISVHPLCYRAHMRFTLKRNHFRVSILIHGFFLSLRELIESSQKVGWHSGSFQRTLSPGVSMIEPLNGNETKPCKDYSKHTPIFLHRLDASFTYDPREPERRRPPFFGPL